MTRYVVLDVFTDVPFGGNQLAVFPDATGLPEDKLQAIAAEFNFSEVTFVYPPDDPNHTAKVRIFTPTMEIPFAGHPTIGTAVALADQVHGAHMVLELGVGPIACNVVDTMAEFTTQAPLERLAEPDPALIAECLGLTVDDMVTTAHAPTMATLGLAFTFTQLKDRETLSRIETDVSAFRRGTALHPSGLDFPQMAYVRDGETIHARMFAPLDNIPEDPATGSAAATLAALLADIEGRNLSLTLHQGVDMGRPSVILLTTHGPQVTVRGAACRVMEGQVLI